MHGKIPNIVPETKENFVNKKELLFLVQYLCFSMLWQLQFHSAEALVILCNQIERKTVNLLSQTRPKAHETIVIYLPPMYLLCATYLCPVVLLK